jgi:thiamine-phosphate pyrophosphorylase
VSNTNWTTRARQLLAGGAGLLQVRAKRESPAERRALAEAVLPLCEAAGVPLIINDDLELARSLPGAGLHVGQDDIDVALAREALGPDRLLGLSTHSPEQARGALDRAHLLNYFAVGPVYPTGTKPDYLPVGLQLVRTVAAMNPPLPWFCIGGINRANAAAVIEAGARRLVSVSAVLLAEDPVAEVQFYRSLL